MGDTMEILICKISVNGQRVSEERIEDLVDHFYGGGRVPPITVRELPDGTFRMVDGRHRLEAHRRLGLSSISSTVTI